MPTGRRSALPDESIVATISTTKIAVAFLRTATSWFPAGFSLVCMICHGSAFRCCHLCACSVGKLLTSMPLSERIHTLQRRNPFWNPNAQWFHPTPRLSAHAGLKPYIQHTMGTESSALNLMLPPPNYHVSAPWCSTSPCNPPAPTPSLPINPRPRSEPGEPRL